MAKVKIAQTASTQQAVASAERRPPDRLSTGNCRLLSAFCLLPTAFWEL